MVGRIPPLRYKFAGAWARGEMIVNSSWANRTEQARKQARQEGQQARQARAVLQAQQNFARMRAQQQQPQQACSHCCAHIVYAQACGLCARCVAQPQLSQAQITAYTNAYREVSEERMRDERTRGAAVMTMITSAVN